MKAKTKTKVWRGFTTITVGLLTIMIGAGTICEGWRENLDQNLGTTSSYIKTEDKTLDGTYAYTSDYTTTDELVQAHKDLNEQLSEEGSVLLKNNGTLPLAAGGSVTLFGTTSHYPYYGGQMGGKVNEEQAISLEQALQDAGYEVNPVMIDVYETLGNIVTGTAEVGGQEQDVYGYRPGKITQNIFGESIGNYSVGEPPVSKYEEANAEYQDSFAQYSDAAIVVIGRSGTEGGDYLPGEDGLAEGESGKTALSLNEEERGMIQLACDNFDRVVVLVNAINAIEIDELKDNEAIDAILWVGYPGCYGFNGVVDVLSGEVNPSGHLSATYAVNSQSSPAMANFGNVEYANGEGATGSMYIVDAEGIYTGYKYYETRYADLVMKTGNAGSTAGSSTGESWNYEDEVSYSFGYGQSYTSFTQTLDSVVRNDDTTMTVTVTVTNTGAVAGKDVAQIYVQTPYTDYDKENLVEKSAIQLIDYVKTDVLQPGESQTLSTTFDSRDFASYDANGAKTYIMDAGDYYIALGNGAHDALNNVLAAQGYTTEDGMDYDGQAALTYKWVQEELDTTTYSVAENGTEITNHLEDMDLNYWQPGTVTYLSRQDWEGTWPKSYNDISITENMQPYMDSDFYEIKTDEDTSDIFPEKDNDLSFLSMAGVDKDDALWDELMDQVSLEEAIYGIRVGGTQPKKYDSVDMIVDAFESDGPAGISGGTLLARQDDPDSPTYVSKDDPNASYYLNDYVAESVVASTFNKELAEAQGLLFGNDSLWSNITIFFAPGMNLQRAPYNGRNEEYYSEDPMLTSYTGGAVIKGARSKGCLITVKHFAFNEQESGRVGVSTFMTEQRARETEIRAFEGAVDNGMLSLMTALNRVGITYASAHTGLLQDILYGEMGYEGFLMTDILISNFAEYQTVKESVVAGTTLMGISSDSLAGADGPWSYFTVDGVKGDRTLVQAIRDNTKNLFYALANSNAMNGVNETSKVVSQMTWWRWAYATGIGVTGVLTLFGIGMYVRECRKKGKEA